MFESKEQRTRRHFNNLENELISLALFGDADLASELCGRAYQEFCDGDTEDTAQAKVWAAIQDYINESRD